MSKINCVKCHTQLQVALMAKTVRCHVCQQQHCISHSTQAPPDNSLLGFWVITGSAVLALAMIVTLSTKTPGKSFAQIKAEQNAEREKKWNEQQDKELAAMRERALWQAKRIQKTGHQ